jgi:hypothetical protein
MWPAHTAVLATRPGILGSAAAVALLALGLRWLWLGLAGRFANTQPAHSAHRTLSTFLFPFLLLLVYIFWPQVSLLTAAILLFGAAGLSLALALRALERPERWHAWRWVIPLTLATLVLAAYLRTVGQTVGAADTFEIQVVAPTLGIVHPTGYPLLVLIGKLFSLIPIGLVAWRVNLVSVACATVATVLLYFSLARLTGQRAISALAAACLAFSHVFWSQAVEAEVYALNAAFIAAILLLLVGQVDTSAHAPRRWLFALAALCGLSLTNHLTAVIIGPAVVLGVWFARPQLERHDWLLAATCFAAPLLLDLYIPVRWPALHNGEWMKFGDFIVYITGQQFRGAVQFGLWREPTRWNIVGGLMLEAFGPAGMVLASAGLVVLVVRKWRLALLTLGTFCGYFFYGLIYNVADVSVFILPAHILLTLWMGVAAAHLTRWLSDLVGKNLAPSSHSEHSEETETLRFAAEADKRRANTCALLWTAFALLPLSLLWTNGPLLDQSASGWKLYNWGKYVMGLPMPLGSAILADSEKIAPLYYLKRIENVRPDVETIVLGDEGLYRAELDRRVAAGQPTYLARYLPGIAGPYRLHSLGPLVRVTAKTMPAPPPMLRQLDNVTWGSGQMALLGLDVERGLDDVAWRVTLYWQARVKLEANYHVRLRWVGPSGQVWWQDHGAHPVNGYNPTGTWLPDEVVTDYHEIPTDPAIPPDLLRLDVGLFLPFRDEGLNVDGTNSPWFTLVLLDQVPSQTQTPGTFQGQTMRANFGDELLITSASDPGVSPPGEPTSVIFEWSRLKPGPDRRLRLRWTDERDFVTRESEIDPYAGEYPTSQWPVGQLLVSRVTLPAPPTAGEYSLRVAWLDADRRELPARCAWLAPVSHDCTFGTLRVEGAGRGQGINFDNQVFLLDAQINEKELRPNETLHISLKWQGLRQWNADYTVFVHLIGPDGKLYGQVDQWPLDGTLATRDWLSGRVVDDPYRIPLMADAPPGDYQVEVGWYLLATLRRLPVVDAEGRPVDDHVIIGTVTVHEQ